MPNRLIKIKAARELRKTSTKAENFLWEFLRHRNFCGKKFRRQHIFQGFIIDFYCADERLAIELDGAVHDKSKDYDIARDEVLKKQHIRILRFKNKEVFNNIEIVLSKIKENLLRKNFPSPL